jgi:rhamnosyltransferase subunit B
MKFLLTTWGSDGDLHPLLALGQEMLRRGHEVTLAGNPHWREMVEQSCITFIPMGPRQSSDMVFGHPEVISSKKFGLASLSSLMRIGVAPMLEESYQVLCEAAQDHDVLVAHFLVFAAGTVAEKTGIDWATISLAPGVVPSRHTMPAGSYLQPFSGVIGEIGNHLFWRLCGYSTQHIVDPYVNRLRKKIGLSSRREVFYKGTSPRLNLQLCSSHFAQRPLDWSSEKKQAGFCYWDPLDTFVPSLSLQKFLLAGPKPWLFTLGTAAVTQPGGFYTTAIEAMRGIPERAIILTGLPQNNFIDLPSNVFVLNYAPYGWIIPRCSVVAHHCGIGTISHVLRAGLPSVTCPFAFDQPNNAMRLQALGVAKYLPPAERTASGFRAAMRKVEEGPMVARAQGISERLREENGPERACEILESTFKARMSKRPIFALGDLRETSTNPVVP